MDFPISTPRPMPRRPPVRSVQYMSTATKDHPAGSLRVSDADRDRAIAELSEHYQAGRLTTEELEDRTGRALQARTTADLPALLSGHPFRVAWLPVVAIIVVRLLLGGRGRRRCDRRLPR